MVEEKNELLGIKKYEGSIHSYLVDCKEMMARREEVLQDFSYNDSNRRPNMKITRGFHEFSFCSDLQKELVSRKRHNNLGHGPHPEGNSHNDDKLSPLFQ